MSKFAFNPPRWSKTKSGDIVAYHGTSRDNEEHIRKEGITVTKGRRNYSGHGLYKGNRAKVVYLTADPEDAKEWGEAAAGKKASVLKVHIPSSEHHRFDHSNDDPYEGRFKGDIPPDWIK